MNHRNILVRHSKQEYCVPVNLNTEHHPNTKVCHKEAPFRHVLLYLIISVGNMSGDRQQAFWNPQDFTLMILQACAKYGIAPDVDWDMEMTPVDFAAEFVVRCSYNLSSILGKTYHIINDKPLHSR